MTQQQKTALVGALVLAGAAMVVRFADNSEAIIDPTILDDCSYQPPGFRSPPCLPDGGFRLGDNDYLDAGCLSIVCPRWARVATSGKSSFLPTRAELDMKAAETAAKVDAKPVEAKPVEAAPATLEAP